MGRNARLTLQQIKKSSKKCNHSNSQNICPVNLNIHQLMIRIFLIALISLPATGFGAETTRTGFPPPAENLPVFRCVLDGRSRCLIYNLSPKLSIAWDTENALLWRAWVPRDPKLPVKLQGAAYDGRHGPQPVHDGKLIVDSDTPQFTTESESGLITRYLGHKYTGKDRKLELSWNLLDKSSSKKVATVTQSIELSGDQLTLSITCVSPEGTVNFNPPPGLKWNQSNNEIALKQGVNLFTATIK